MEELELVGSTKQKLNLPPRVDCDFHQPNKVNYFIPCLTHPSNSSHIKELLSFEDHGVAHTTSMLETDCIASKWNISRLPPNLANQCWAMHAIAKVGTSKHDTHAPTYNELKKEFRSTNNVEYG